MKSKADMLREYFANNENALKTIDEYESKGEQCWVRDLEIALSLSYGIPQVKLDEINGFAVTKKRKKKK